jgi:hypothetical protein
METKCNFCPKEARYLVTVPARSPENLPYCPECAAKLQMEQLVALPINQSLNGFKLSFASIDTVGNYMEAILIGMGSFNLPVKAKRDPLGITDVSFALKGRQYRGYLDKQGVTVLIDFEHAYSR